MDVVFLSRLQFAFTTAFHILFPTLTIGLAVYLVAVEAFWLRTKDEMYYRMYRFWVKIFAVHFAVGVVSGITLEFEFGTNFSAFSQAVSNVFAPLLAYEGMTAFFLEAGFLGIMLFGWKRVPPIIHFLSTCLVAAGASLSAFWIMAANSWMQTPAGFDLVEGEFFVTSFREVIFNPAFPTALAHMLIASYETAAFVIAGIAAWFLLKGEHVHFFRRTLGLALVMALIFAPLQVLVGDLKGLSVAEHQPAKLAAMEGHWRTNEAGGADFILFGIPDMEAERNRFEIAVPNVLSWIVTHSADGKIQGLKEFPPEDRPNALITYWSFRVMAGIGFVFVLVALRGAWLWYRKRLFEDRGFLRTLILVQPLGFVAVVMGWITTEVGRQPWVVYGLMRTADGVSPIPAGNVVWSLTMFVLFFAFIGGTYFHYILRILRNGPDMESPIPSIQRPSGMRPLDDALRGA